MSNSLIRPIPSRTAAVSSSSGSRRVRSTQAAILKIADQTHTAKHVLTEKDHCYCVLLNSHDGAAFPSADVKTDKDSSGSNTNTDPRRVKDPKVTLFSGFVSYQMVREAYEGGRNRFGSLLSLGHHSGKADRLYMKGPGGRGEVEVAVSGVIDQSQVVLGPVSPMSSKKSIDLGSIFRKAASVASVAAKHAIAAATASYDEDEMFPLKCCLMSISLPWDTIAHDLLFKVNKPFLFISPIIKFDLSVALTNFT
ncbi:hypothetical protein F2Q68_00031479 [Brassica cretica]|uniref:Uncharacterized protein n=1 Tax=Brassica cretica TaxID=69181 RepID=A0A8S9GAH4_BRACR|nr:hypothetical protein F2Q68_00031479 [Brassica cretica]